MKYLLAWSLWLLALPVSAQEQGPLDGARERWEAMTPDQRSEIQRRFEELRTMDSERRGELEQRFESLRAAERSTVAELPESVRRELDALPPSERREVLRECARDALAERGREVRERLPGPVRERLEGARLPERFEALREIKRAHRAERLERALEQLGRELELPAEERERSRHLSPEQKEARLLELHRERSARDGAAAGPAQARAQPPDSGGRARLGELMHPDPRWRIELRGLSGEARRSEISGRLRERVLEFLERNPGVLAPGELERLRELEGEAFLEAVRSRSRGERGGDRGPPDRNF